MSEFDGPCREELAGQDEPEPLEDGYSGDEGRNEEILSQRRLFRFGAISDRDKGMRKAFEEVFPSIFLWNCAMHIKRNVQDRFGTSCGDEVIDIAKTFSKSVEAQLFERLRNKNAAAERYLKGIDPKVWRSTAMLGDIRMPPRFGIVSSNGVESSNSMFREARHGSWMDTIESVLYIMARRISELRQKYLEVGKDEIVATVLSNLKANWGAAAGYQILQMEQDEFHVSYNGIPSETASRPQLVIPRIRFCTCGEWQDPLYPCRHACTWARKWAKMAYRDFFSNATDFVHKGDSLQSMFAPNIRLVILDNIDFDGISRPNPKAKRSGRPRTKRMRRRKNNGAEDSGYCCSRCGREGHNRRTCTTDPKDFVNRDIN